MEVDGEETLGDVVSMAPSGTQRRSVIDSYPWSRPRKDELCPEELTARKVNPSGSRSTSERGLVVTSEKDGRRKEMGEERVRSWTWWLERGRGE